LHARHAASSNQNAVAYRRERWPTPDGDFMDVDFLEDDLLALYTAAGSVRSSAPLLVLFHGLEGSSRSHYALAFARMAGQQGWAFAVPHFRGCSSALNLAPRAYHSGDFEEVGWVLDRLRLRTTPPLLVVGVSLGGNAVLRWAEEMGTLAKHVASAVASISAPVDLTASGLAMGQGFNRLVYTRMFLNTMKPKAMRKLTQYPGLFDAQKLQAARTLYDFDNVFTAPLHGFKNTADYWHRASAKPHLTRIEVPTLLVNAQNDPFVPASSLPGAREVSRHVTLWQPRKGGHVGFAQEPWPGLIHVLPHAVAAWAAPHAGLLLKEVSGG
jgi:predicted alpha/beta-fold hydrolase